ncbi:MAG TPA: sulfatase, partial [Candidatus Hydrogenedentes bacterium]|nr:sulfatase [Candidatus Hydrogenedentota bacterium]
ERYRYTRYADGSEELYDHQSDPGEKENRALNEEYRPIMDAFQKWLPKTNREPAPGSGGSDSPLYGELQDYGY